MPFYQRRIIPERLPERNILNDVPFDTFSDITNQTLANVIRQLSCMTQLAEEILGDSGNALANQQSRIQSLSHRVEKLNQKVQILNPKQAAQSLNQSSASPSSYVYQSPSNVEKRLFMQKNRPQSVVRLQSGLEDDYVPYKLGRSSSMSPSCMRPSRPRSLESDVLLLPENIPTDQSRRDRAGSLNQIEENNYSYTCNPSPISDKLMKRATTITACHPSVQAMSSNVQRQLLAQFNQRNESESSSSPERENISQHELHGFADNRLALVRRSMIARRTQARLREKRRRNRTVALSPEDDRRSSFISTFLADTKQLQDQSCQVPSQHSTLSKNYEESPGESPRVPVDGILSREFELISKQMEPQDTSSGCWSGGSTIQGGFEMPVTPTLLIQELNDQNLFRHNQLTSSVSIMNHHIGRHCIDFDYCEKMSSTDSSLIKKPKPLPPVRFCKRSERPCELKLMCNLPSENSGNSMHVLEVKHFGYPAPIVLTPSEPSESGLNSNQDISEFQFPSPPKHVMCVPDPYSSIHDSPGRSTSSRSEVNNSLSSEVTKYTDLSGKISEKLNNVELEAEQSFEIEDIVDGGVDIDIQSDSSDHKLENLETVIPFDTSQDEEISITFITPPKMSHKLEPFSFLPKTLDLETYKLPAVSLAERNQIYLQSVDNIPSVEVIWDSDLDNSISRNPIPEPITPIKTPTAMLVNSDSDDVFETKSNESPIGSPCRYGRFIQPSENSSPKSLLERGRTNEKRETTKRLAKTNSANFKSLLLRSIGANDKTTRSSAAERLKVAPGMTLQDLYRPKSTDLSPHRKVECINQIDSSPRKVRNKSKNRYTTMHRLTSIVEEKDILAAKDLCKTSEESHSPVPAADEESSIAT